MTRPFGHGAKILLKCWSGCPQDSVIAAPTARGVAALNAKQRWKRERYKVRVVHPLRKKDFNDGLLALEVVAS
jgi:hypothetical protein